MSLTAQIGSSADAFKLSQKLVSSLAEKFGFKFEDGWAVVSSRSVENVQKRLKREKKKNNPAALVKHPRTAFSFFTQKQRPVEAKAHPEATFGQLSGFVASTWKNLSASELQKYKDMETADKARYQTERAAAIANAPAPAPAPATPAVATEAHATAPVEPKAKKASKAKASAVATEAPATVASVPAPAKAGKATKAKATPAPAVASAPVATAPAPAKAPKAKATPAPAPASAPAKATPAPAKASAKKAGKQ